jgi:nitrite reductase/ring-hydroxylating ferredoxin subunit
MSNESWVPAIDENQLFEGRAQAVYPKGLPILLVKQGERIFAISNKCAHMGCLLTSGRLFGHIIQCPCHDWQFDIRTGKSTDAPELKLAVYPWKRENGRILIDIGVDD